jgi:ABC-type amino acid transport substrate-binding protein
MKRKMLFLLLIAAVFFSGTNLYAGTIKMGYFMLPPHQFKADEPGAKHMGAGITYFEAVAAKLGDTVEWVGPLPLPRLTEYLKTGTQIDGTVGFPKVPAFEEFLYYTATPLYMGQATLAVAKSSPLTEIKDIDDIRGFRIGLVKSSSNRYNPLIDENRSVIQLEELGGDKWMEQNLEKLVSGRLNALFDRQPYTLAYVAATLKLDQQIKTLPMPSPPSPMFVVFAKSSKQGKALLDKYNANVSQVNLNYEELLQTEIKKVK